MKKNKISSFLNTKKEILEFIKVLIEHPRVLAYVHEENYDELKKIGRVDDLEFQEPDEYHLLNFSIQVRLFDWLKTHKEDYTWNFNFYKSGMVTCWSDHYFNSVEPNFDINEEVLFKQLGIQESLKYLVQSEIPSYQEAYELIVLLLKAFTGLGGDIDLPKVPEIIIPENLNKIEKWEDLMIQVCKKYAKYGFEYISRFSPNYISGKEEFTWNEEEAIFQIKFLCSILGFHSYDADLKWLYLVFCINNGVGCYYFESECGGTDYDQRNEELFKISPIFLFFEKNKNFEGWEDALNILIQHGEWIESSVPALPKNE